jgi:hypothetical protein
MHIFCLINYESHECTTGPVVFFCGRDVEYAPRNTEKQTNKNLSNTVHGQCFICESILSFERLVMCCLWQGGFGFLPISIVESKL